LHCEVRRGLAILGASAVPFFRTVRCLSPGTLRDAHEQVVNPPDLKFESTGYWRPLKPGEIGEDKDGQAIAQRFDARC
jgi:hypothetical protein